VRLLIAVPGHVEVVTAVAVAVPASSGVLAVARVVAGVVAVPAVATAFVLCGCGGDKTFKG
jgi:hypothetical protein